jgi:hypothetical protein
MACMREAPPSGSPNPQDIAYGSAALDLGYPPDQELMVYGQAHPHCELWSNWQKLCSRTGPGRTVRCVIDPGRSVEPSAPFCQVEIGGPESEPSGEEVISSERYCLAREDWRAWSPRTGTRTRRVCTRHMPDRPFNGRRIASLDHSACQSWIDRETRETVCTRSGDAAAGVPSCEVLRSSGYEHPRLLACGRWSREIGCGNPHPTIRAPDPSSEAWIESLVMPDGAAVNGTFCEI